MGIAMVIALAGSVYQARAYLRHKNAAAGLLAALGLGLLLYILYVISVGGNQRYGRFWSLHVAIAVWINYALAMKYRRGWIRVAAAMGVVLIFVATPKMHVLKVHIPYAFGHMFGGLFPNELYFSGAFRKVVPDHASFKKEVTSQYAIGRKGYEAGPNVFIIDRHALADAFLARLKSPKNFVGVVGHFGRDIPKGYVKALKDGSTEQMSPQFAQYYSKLRVVIRDDVWSMQRFDTIWAFQRGYYDHLLK
jgi:arabinofuranosyltransferase